MNGPWQAPMAGLLAMTLLIIAGSGPVLLRSQESRHVVLLIDISAAARTAPWKTPAGLRKILRNSLKPGTRVTLVIFARYPHLVADNVRVGSARNWPLRWPKTVGICGNLRRALCWRATLPLNAISHLPRWLFTTDADRWNIAPGWKPPYQLALTAIRPGLADAGVIALGVTPLPGAAVGKVGFNIRVRIAATGKIPIRALVLRSGTPVANAAIVFRHAGERTLLLRDYPPDYHANPPRYTVRLQTHDPWPEDDYASIYAPPIGAMHILLVTNHATAPSPLLQSKVKAAKRTPIITRIMPAAIPIGPGSLARLTNFQAIVLDNISRSSFPAGGGTLLEKYVREAGGGLLIAGSSRAFGPGGYGLPSASGSVWPVEKISPLSALPPTRPPLSVVFLLDSSGSMGQKVPDSGGQTRFDVAAGSVAAAATLLKPQDGISVLTFAGEARQILSGRVRLIKSKIHSTLAEVKPTGPTNPNAALPLLRRLLRPRSLLILLTDGHIPSISIHKWITMLDREQTRLVVVAGNHHTSPALAALLRHTHAQLAVTHNPGSWSRLLRQSVYQYLAGQPQSSPLLWHWNTNSPGGTTVNWIRTWLKAGASDIANGQNPKHLGKKAFPLAAWWRRGVGKVGAICFTDESDAFAPCVARLLTTIASPKGRRWVHIRTQRIDGRWHISADEQKKGQFINNAEIALHLLGAQASDAKRLFTFRQTAPGYYDLTLPHQVKNLDAVVFQAKVSSKENLSPSGHRPQRIVAHIAPATLPPLCLPATAPPSDCPLRTVMHIYVKRGKKPVQWQPVIRGYEWHLSMPLLLLATLLVMAMLALARRQGFAKR